MYDNLLTQAMYKIQEYDFSEAHALLKSAVEFAKIAGTADELIYCFGVLGNVEFRLGNIDASEWCLIEAMTIRGGSPEAYLSIKCDLADIMIARKQNDHAWHFLCELLMEVQRAFPPVPNHPPPPLIECVQIHVSNTLQMLRSAQE